MLIVITSNTSWYIYNFRKNTIKSLIERGHSVLAIAPKDQYSSRLKQLGCIFLHIPLDQGGTNPIKDIITFISFLKIYFLHKPNIILNFTPKNNIYSTLAASIFHIPCINNIAGLGFLFVNESFSSKIARLLYKISQHKAKLIFFQNDDDRELFLRHNLSDKNATDRIPGSGVDLSRFHFTPAKDDGVVKFILVARMIYDKGVCEYVDAARIIKQKYSNTKFFLLGFLDVNNPSAVSKYDMNIWVSEGIVEYLGVSDSVENEISKVDCVVLPSTYREGIPKSLLEAGAVGKPIITTNSIGCKEVVIDGVNGFLCKPKNSVDLAEKMEKIILMSHQDRLSMGYRGRLRIEKDFDEQLVINKYLDAIERIALITS
ncbi:N,N'-diacetylbacillosaminyl-diphospho-undecaprenol alpha-1,3-N-acetylgalactosaminyltransferase [anaerobic digester metagenome]